MHMLEVTLGYKDAELARQVKQLRLTTEQRPFNGL